MTTSTRFGLIEDIVISIVVFLVVSLRNTDGTVIQGANSESDIDNLYSPNLNFYTDETQEELDKLIKFKNSIIKNLMFQIIDGSES